MFYERALILKVVFARGQDEKKKKIIIKVWALPSYEGIPEFLRSRLGIAPPIPPQKRQGPSLAQDLSR